MTIKNSEMVPLYTFSVKFTFAGYITKLIQNCIS